MGFLIMKLWEGVASVFRLFLVSFYYFVKTSIFFHPLNRNDDLKESGVGVGLIGILGVRVGILGKLGVGPYTFRLRNPGEGPEVKSRARSGRR